MSSLARTSRVPVVCTTLFLMVLLALIGCAPNPDTQLISPDLGPQLVLAQSEGAVEILPTPEPPKLAELSDDEIYAGLDPAVQDAILNANLANGETIALTFGCVGCHALDPNQTMTGPTWHNMGDTAVTRIPGQSPAAYLYESIVQTDAYIVPDYPANIMPANFGETMSPEQVADMVAYLLAQNGQ